MNSKPVLDKSYEVDGQSEIFRYYIMIQHEESDLHKQMIFDRMKSQVGTGLYELIHRFKSPCVIEIEEDIQSPYRFSSDEFTWMDRIQITVKIKNVHHRDVIIPRIPVPEPILCVNQNHKNSRLLDRIFKRK